MIARDSLQARLDTFPRLGLGRYPTPLEPLPRLTRALGRPVYVKRDDLTSPASGGNKTRNLDYLMADAQRRRARRVVTFGGLHSNHARLTAEVARDCGMEPHVLYFERRPSTLQGNARLAEIEGARLHFVPLGRSRRAGMTIETAIRLVRLLAWGLVGPHYFVPVGGYSSCGCLGYVRAAIEIDEQTRSLGIERSWLLLPAGTGATLAGLLAGCTLTGSPLRLLGVDIGNLWTRFPSSIARMATEVCARLGGDRTFSPRDVSLIERRYTGEAYALPSAAGTAAIEYLDRLEGIRLDPVYTGKAFAGLLDLVERGELAGSDPVIFLHTGGVAQAASRQA